ncbi:MAG: glycosyltransferase family 4 protein [Candidatus Nanopelagicales bacterium]
MRVLHLISSAGLYGAEKMVTGLCAGLPPQGVEPVLGVFRNSHLPNTEVADYARARGVSVELVECRGRFDVGAVRYLRGRLADFDVVHSHGFKSNLYAFAASRGGRAAFVSTCHRFDQTLRDTLDRPILKRADLVTAVSAEAADSLRRVYRLDRVRTIPNGVPIPPARQRREHPHPLVAMAARLAPEKAPADFVRAAADVHRRHPEARFTIAGDGPERDAVEQLVAESDVPVEMRGFIEDMPGLYGEIDVLVQPSYREGMPMTLLEAMAAEVAVVATRVGAAPDFIEDGVTGLLVPPADVAGLAGAIERLVTDPGMRRRMAAAGRTEVATRYSESAMAAHYAEAYRAVVTPRTGPAAA